MGWADACKSFSDKAVDGQWKCTSCYVKNLDEVIDCQACETPRPGFEEQSKKQKDEKAAKEQAAKAAARAAAGGSKIQWGAKPGGFTMKKPGEKKAAGGGFAFKAPSSGGAKPAGTGFAFKAPGGAKPAGTGFAFKAPGAATGGDPAAKKQKTAAPAAFGAPKAAGDGSKPAWSFKAGGGGAAAVMPKATSASKDTDEITATLYGEGKLGLSFKKDIAPPVIKSISGGSLTATCAPQLAEGMTLTSVAGKSVDGLTREEALELIKSATRPFELSFKRSGIVRPKRELNETSEITANHTVGSVLACGSGEIGQLGLGTKVLEAYAPEHIALLDRKNIVKIAAGGLHTVVLDEDGLLWSWGCDDDGALGRDDSRDEGVPRAIKSIPEPVVDIACGLCHCIALTKSGSVYTWGTYKDANGYVGYRVVDGERVKLQKTPALVEELEGQGVCFINSGGNHALAITAGGELWAWGNGEEYQLGRPIAQKHKLEGLTPKRVEFAVKRKREGDADGDGIKIVHAAGGGSHTLAIDSEGRCYGFGLNTRGQCGLGHNESPVMKPTPITALDGSGVVQFAAGQLHSICCCRDGSVSCWGRGDYSQLGYPCPPRKVEESNRFVPIKVVVPGDTMPKAISVSAGDNHSLYVSEDRALFTWGFGESGALGLGEVEALPSANSAGDVTQPTEVDAELIAGGGHGAEVLQAAAGSQHTVILAL